MKKKVFSKLLMVALVATVGAFTSCKDYDDDINDLRSQINGLNTSLTSTVESKITTVNQTIADLDNELAEVNQALKDADAILRAKLDEVERTGKVNIDDIESLRGLVVSTYATQQLLKDAKDELQKGLDEANRSIQATNKDYQDADNAINKDIQAIKLDIVGLVNADNSLSDRIESAKALINETKEDLKKAQDLANNNAKDIQTLNGKVSDLSTSLSEKVGEINSRLDGIDSRITSVYTTLSNSIETVNGNINKLDERVKTNEGDITDIKTKIDALKEKDTEILAALEKAKKDLNDKIDANYTALDGKIDANKSELEGKINAGDDALQKQLDKAIERISATEGAIKVLTETTIPALYSYIDTKIPDEVEKQLLTVLPQKLSEYMKAVEIEKLVNEKTAANKSLIDALTEQVELQETQLKNYTDAQLEIAKAYLVQYADDNIKTAVELTAGELRQAYQDADAKLQGDVTIIRAELESVKTILYGSFDEETGEPTGGLGDLQKWFDEVFPDTENNESAVISDEQTDAPLFAGESESKPEQTDAPLFASESESKPNPYIQLENLTTNIWNHGRLIEKVKGLIFNLTSKTMTGAITSINLYANQHQAQDNQGGFDGFNHDLIFTYAIEKNNVFPAADLQQFVDTTITFTEGFVQTYTDSILVRVSPINAELDKDLIVLINSQGEDIVGDSIVKVVSAERYTRPAGQYITRATNDGETGLWVIKFKLQDKKSDVWEKFMKASLVDVNGEKKQIVYAVGVKTALDFERDEEGQLTETGINDSTAYANTPRYVISEYDLGLGTREAKHIWDFNVNNETVAKIHNRYVVNENKPNTGNELWTDDKASFPESYWVEKTYAYNYGAVNCFTINEDYPGLTPAEFTEANVVDRYNHKTLHAGGYNTNGVDNRHEFPVKLIQFNRTDETGTWADINIDFPTVACNGTRSTEIAGFYVTLDQEFARESNSSEVTAWTSYWYDGVGFYCVNNGQFDAQRQDSLRGVKDGICKAKLFRGTNGTISIKDYNSAKGDVIGFRVYAVNLDGTLYDPDGRAFYVKVGDNSDSHTLAFEVTATKVSGDSAYQKSENIAEYNADKNNANKFFNVKQTEINKGGFYTLEWTWAEGNPVVHYLTQNVTPVAGTKGFLNFDLISYLFDFSFSSDAAAAIGADSWKSWSKAATGTIEKPYADIQKVCVALKAANSLIDGATYKLNLDVVLNSPDGSKAVVDKIEVSIKKVMPTELPKAFKVRGASASNVIKYDENIYVRPMKYVNRLLTTQTGKTWDIDSWFDASAEDYGFSKLKSNDYLWASDTRSYNFEEMFAGIESFDSRGQKVYDKNYIFQLDGAGDFATKNAEGDAVSTYLTDNTAAAIDMSHYGLDAHKANEVVMQPKYVVPYVHYSVVGQSKYFKAGYIYRGISFDPENGIAFGSDYKVAPQYFNHLGRFVKETKDAAFKANFKCALDGEFTIKATANPATVIVYDANNRPTSQYDGSAAKKIPYGVNFDVAPGNVTIPTVDWKNTLPVYKNGAAVASNSGASYHRVAFDKIQGVSAVAKGTFYNYEVTGMTPNSNWLLNNFAGLVQVSGPKPTINRLGVITPGTNALSISGGKYKVDGKEYTLTKEQIEDFYQITNSNGTLKFKFIGNSNNPTKIEYIQINLSSEPTQYKVVSMWNHVTDVKSVAPASLTVNIGDPLSSDNIQSRQAR